MLELSITWLFFIANSVNDKSLLFCNATCVEITMLQGDAERREKRETEIFLLLLLLLGILSRNLPKTKCACCRSKFVKTTCTH